MELDEKMNSLKIEIESHIDFIESFSIHENPQQIIATALKILFWQNERDFYYKTMCSKTKEKKCSN